MRVVRPDEREPEGMAAYTVIVEDLTGVRNVVIELEAEAQGIPDVCAQLAALRVMVEAIIGLAQAERSNL